jgi:hypothetical protein
MKQRVLFCALHWGASTAGAQWLNAGFEFWTAASGISNPDHWITSNDAEFPDQVRQDPFAQSGSRAVKLMANDALHPAGLIQECTINEVPSFVRYHVQGHLETDDTLVVVSNIRDAFGNLLMVATDEVTKTDLDAGWDARYLYYADAGNGVPNRMKIRFYLFSGNDENGFVCIDQISAITSVGVEEDQAQLIHRVYSSGGQLHLQLSSNIHDAYTIQLYDLQGKLVMQSSVLDTPQISVATNHIHHGIYIIRVLRGNDHWSQKIVITQP